MVDTYVVPLLKIVVLLNAVLVSVTFMTLLERKVIAWVQVRLGPMRVGYHGALQPIADAVKLLLKEDITPARADRWVFTLAPIVSMVPALIAFAVIPFDREATFFGYPVTLVHRGPERGAAVRGLGDVDRRLRHHPRGLRVEQQVPAARRAARLGAAHQLRDRRHDDARQHRRHRRHAQHGRDRRRAVPGGAAGTSSSSRSPS